MKIKYLNKKTIQKVSLVSFFLGIILLLINFIGLLIPLKNPDIYKQKTGFKDDITLTSQQALDIINQPIKNKEQYVRNVNYAINKSVLHYWTGKHEKDYNVILPFYENYLLSTFVQLFYDNPPRYEFCNYKKTLERGVGWCSQVSLALSDVLNKKNIHTNVIAWPDHVVTEVEVAKDKWWMVDPDYGVIVPYSMKDIDTNPSIIKDFYKKAGYSESTAQNLVSVFSSNKKKVHLYNGPGFTECNAKRKYIEDASYIFIWIIPLILIFPYLFIFIKKYNPHAK